MPSWTGCLHLRSLQFPHLKSSLVYVYLLYKGSYKMFPHQNCKRIPCLHQVYVLLSQHPIFLIASAAGYVSWINEDSTEGKTLVVFFFSPGATTPIGGCILQPSSGLYPPRLRGFLITHNDAPHSVGLLWTNDQSVAETSTKNLILLI